MMMMCVCLSVSVSARVHPCWEGECVCVFTSVAMSEQCILSVIFINGYLWVMSADCDGAFKSFGHKGRLCVCKRHYRVIQHESGCTLKGRGSHSCSHLAENCVSVPECLCECLCVRLCGQVIMSPLKKLLRFLVLATSRQNHNKSDALFVGWKTSQPQTVLTVVLIWVHVI